MAHNAAFEWSFIYYHFGVELTNITDTMLLAQLLAAGNMGVERGLGPVAKDVIGVDLDKDQQTSDWSTPVLTKEQLDYAALDAQVLIPLVERLGAEVAGAGLERVAQIENAALAPVARMGLEGMPIDRDGWIAHAVEIEEEMKTLERQMIEADWMPPRPPIPGQPRSAASAAPLRSFSSEAW